MSWQNPVAPPKRRSDLRRRLGKEFYILKRKWKNLTSSVLIASNQQKENLPETVFGHKTPLIRKLKDADMHLQHNKVTNLRLAAATIDGLVIQPGETFSYWRQIGRPSAGKGYLEGIMLSQGKIVSGVGGGLCQLSNLVYWMTLHTPLTVTERWRHSFDVFPDVNRKQPFGSGATCAFNYLDLRIQNNTDNPFQIRLWLDEQNLNGEWRAQWPTKESYEVFESDHLIRQESWGYSRHNRIARRVIDKESGEVIAEEPVAENHAIMMYTPLLEAGSGESQ